MNIRSFREEWHGLLSIISQPPYPKPRLGLIGAASAPADWVRDQIREAKKLTDKPFGVNNMLMSPYADDVAKVIVEEGVKVVYDRSRLPGEIYEDVEGSRSQGDPVIASVALAKRMERCGADALVAEGTEAGGHIGENTTMVLVPQVVDAVNIRLSQQAELPTEEESRQRSCWARRACRWELTL